MLSTVHTSYLKRKTSLNLFAYRLSRSISNSNKKNSDFLNSITELQQFMKTRFYSSSEHRIKEDWHTEDFIRYLQRKSMLLKSKMIEKQQIVIPLPKFLTDFFQRVRKRDELRRKAESTAATRDKSSQNQFLISPNDSALDSSLSSTQLVKFLDEAQRKYKVEETADHRKSITFPFSFSDLAGHGSFLFLAISYLENDFLHLRMYAFSGICLSIIFQYYREKPLWIPIRWNTLFLLINAVMIAALLKEEDDARNIPDEQKLLYRNVFETRGMSPVDYLHLISVAKRLEFQKGDKLVDETKKNTRVYLVKKGSCSVWKNQQKVGNIKQHQFVGAMSFLAWEAVKANAEQLDHAAKEEKKQKERDSYLKDKDKVGPITSLLLDIVPDDVQTSQEVLQHQQEEQRRLSEQYFYEQRQLQQHQEAMDAIPTEMKEIEDASSSSTTTTEGNHPLLDYTYHFWSSTVNALYGITGDASNNPEASESPPQSASSSSSSANPSEVQKSEEGHLGRADVIADEDCVVFSWKFKDLHHLIMHHPSLGVVFERCISEDLNRKMAISWEEEIKARYKQILLGALMDGEVNQKEKNVLAKFRDEYKITADDHERILMEFEWSKEEYESGFKGGPSAATFQDYLTLLKNELSQTYGLSEEARTFLRDYRIQHEIPSDMHYSALKRLGWSLDEYEVGRKLDGSIVYPARVIDEQEEGVKESSHQSRSKRTSPSFLEFIKRGPIIGWIFGEEKRDSSSSSSTKQTSKETPPPASSSKSSKKSEEREPIPDSYSAHIIHALDLMDNMDRYL